MVIKGEVTLTPEVIHRSHDALKATLMTQPRHEFHVRLFQPLFFFFLMPANSKRCGLGCMLLFGSPHTAGEVQNRLNNWMSTIEEEEMTQCSMFNIFFFFLVLLFFVQRKME